MLCAVEPENSATLASRRGCARTIADFFRRCVNKPRRARLRSIATQPDVSSAISRLAAVIILRRSNAVPLRRSRAARYISCPFTTLRSVQPTGGCSKANCPVRHALPQAVDSGDCGDKFLQAFDCIGAIKRGFSAHTGRIATAPGWIPAPFGRSKSPFEAPTHAASFAAALPLKASACLPGATEIATVSPSFTAPDRISSASGSCTAFWIARFSGRAP